MSELTDAQVGLASPEMSDADVGLTTPTNDTNALPQGLSDDQVGLAGPPRPVGFQKSVPTSAFAQPQTSAFGAGARSTVRNVAPMAAFMAASPTGAAYGAGIGAAIPGLDATGIPEAIGGLIGGLITGTGAAWAAHKAQSTIADAIDPATGNPFSSASEAQDESEHPIASEVGSLLAVGKPNPLNIVRAARTLASDEGRAAITSLASSVADKDGYKAWQEATAPELQKQVNNVINVGAAGGLNAAFQAYDQLKSGNYSVGDLTRAAAEGTLFNEPWIHATHPASKPVDAALNSGSQSPDEQSPSDVRAPAPPETEGQIQSPPGDSADSPPVAGQPPAVAPVKFVGLQEGMPSMGWFTPTAPFDAPDGSTYKPGSRVMNGQLQRWGMELPPDAVTDFQSAQKTAAPTPEPPKPPAPEPPSTIIGGVTAVSNGDGTHTVNIGDKPVATIRYTTDASQVPAADALSATLPVQPDGLWYRNDPTTGQPTIYINPAAQHGPVFTHEVTHMLKDLGVLNDEQVNQVVEKYGGDIKPEIQQRYQDFMAKNNLPPVTGQALNDEVFANLLQGWHANNNAPKYGVIQKAIDFVRNIIGLKPTAQKTVQDLLTGSGIKKSLTTEADAQPKFALPPEQPEQRIFGYTWDQIKSKQQGGNLSEAIRGSAQRPKAKESDYEALKQHGLEGLQQKEMYGVLDRLGLPMKPVEPPPQFSIPKKRAQVAGTPEIGQMRDTENIADIQKTIRERLFDSTKPVSDEQTAAAEQIFDEMTNPKTRGSNAQAVDNTLGNSRLGLALYKHEIERYALKLWGAGDISLLRRLFDSSEDFQISTGGGASSSGSELRALRETADIPLMKELKTLYTAERDRAIANNKTLDRDEFFDMLGKLRGLKLTPAEVEETIKTGKTPDGKPISKVLDENTVEKKEAQSLLDKYEKSQTEWLKPEGKKSVIRTIVDAAIGENKLARFDEKDFRDRLSQRLQEASVPADIADRLAHEVWKDKNTREATRTFKTLKDAEQFEQKRAQQILDRLQTDQTETQGTARKSKVADLIKKYYDQPEDAARKDELTKKLESDLASVDGVDSKTAKELAFEAGQRKDVVDTNNRIRDEKIEAQSTQKFAEQKLKDLQQRNSGVEWSKVSTTSKKVSDIITQKLSAKNKTPVDANLEANIKVTADELVAAGVDPKTAGEIGYQIEQERQAQFANRRTRQMERASKSKSTQSLTESILASSVKNQSDPAWIKQTAESWFESNGLSKEQAQAASRIYSDKFAEAFANAKEKIARQVLSKTKVGTQEDIIKLIKAGALDPSSNWADILAEKAGWKKPTADQARQLGELQDKISDDNTAPVDRVIAANQQNSILRNLGNHDGGWYKALGEAQAASLLSGIKTMTLHLFQPFGSMLFRDLPVALFTQPKDFASLTKSFMNASKNFFPELKFAWQRDAFTFAETELNKHHSELRKQFDLGVEEWKKAADEFSKGNYAGAAGDLTVNNWKKGAIGPIRLMYAWQHYVFRALQTANQAGMSVMREFKLALYGSQAMRDAGFNSKQVGEMVDAIAKQKNAFYQEGIIAGMDKDKARVNADVLTARTMEGFFANDLNLGDSAAANIVRNAEADAYSQTGFHPKGISEEEEGFVSKAIGINDLMGLATKLRNEGGLKSVLGITMFGFVNVPLRVMRFNANYSPYGIFRWGINRYLTTHGKETPWKQSFANDAQTSQRLREALVGTSIMLGFLGYAFAGDSSASDNRKKAFFLYATGSGPKDKTLRDAWERDGFRPYSLNIGLNGSVVAAVPITRVGSVLAWPLGAAAAADDVAWQAKEAAAAGRPINTNIASEAAQMAGTYYELVGAQGIFQGISHLQQISEGGGGMAKVLASAASGILSPILMPGKQLLSSVSQMIWGNPDRSSISAAIAANFPIIGMPWAHPQINSIGDVMGDRSWYGNIANAGLPIAFQVSDNPQNRALYQAMVDKGVAPPDLKRTVLEDKYGPLTDDQFTQFAIQRGAQMKAQLMANLPAIQSGTSADAKSIIQGISTAAENSTATNLGLVHAPPKRTSLPKHKATTTRSKLGSRARSIASLHHSHRAAVLAHHHKSLLTPSHSGLRSHHTRSAFS